MATATSNLEVGSREHTVKWFDETTSVPAQARDLLENYSHISPAEVQEHVIALRNKAWEVWPYPCLGQFRFLELNLANRTDLYPRLLAGLRTGSQKFLDVGCCLGQDIRKLVYDGVPGECLVGLELEAGFIDLGYELFRDRDTLKARFISGSIISDGQEALKALEEQVKAFQNAIKLLRHEGDVAIIGQASGNLDGLASVSWRKNTFRHNVQSFEKLISEVGTKTDTAWDVRASLDEGLSIHDGKRTWDDPKTRRLLFEVRRKSS